MGKFPRKGKEEEEVQIGDKRRRRSGGMGRRFGGGRCSLPAKCICANYTCVNYIVLIAFVQIAFVQSAYVQSVFV